MGKNEGGSAVVPRNVRVRGNNTLTLEVKVVREESVYVCARERLHLRAGPARFAVLEGAVLVRKSQYDRNGWKFYSTFNGGIYDALRSLGAHAPDAMARDAGRVRLFRDEIAQAIRYGQQLRVGSSSPEQFAAYDRSVGVVAEGLQRALGSRKREAHDAARRGSNHLDSLGRPNLPSREGFLWTALHSLDLRLTEGQDILAHTNGRHRVVAELLASVLATFEEMEANARRAFDRKDAVALRHEARRLRHVSLAPFGRHAAPRIALALDAAAGAIECGNQDVATALEARALRLFRLVHVRHEIEAMHACVSRLSKAKEPPGKEDVDLYVVEIDRLLGLLRDENGIPLDAGCEREHVFPVAEPALRNARDACRNLFGDYHPSVVHEAFRQSLVGL